mgnify:CR=1 FL=1
MASGVNSNGNDCFLERISKKSSQTNLSASVLKLHLKTTAHRNQFIEDVSQSEMIRNYPLTKVSLTRLRK